MLALGLLLTLTVAGPRSLHAEPDPAPPSGDMAAPGLLIPPGHENEILGLITPMPPGVTLAGVSIEETSIRFLVEADPVSATLQVRDLAAPRVIVEPPLSDLDASVRGSIELLAQRLEERATAQFFQSIAVAPEIGGGEAETEPVRATWLFALLALPVAILLVMSLRRPSPWMAVLWFGAALVAGMSSVWLAQGRGLHPVQGLVTWLFWVVIGVALHVAGSPMLRKGTGSKSGRSWQEFGLQLATGPWMVVAWSLFVRFVLTTQNVLTDGGSLQGRVLNFNPNFGADHVLLDTLFAGNISIAAVLGVNTFLAALAPLGVYLIAQGLRLPGKSALWAGLMLASWPIHAALFSSDFESGPTMALCLLGLGLLFLGARGSRPDLTLVGGTLAAFGLWGRPEPLILGVPVALSLWLYRDNLRNKQELWVGFAWLGLIALTRVLQIGLDGYVSDKVRGVGEGMFFASFIRVPWGRIVSTDPLFPWWLILGLVALPFVGRRLGMPLLLLLASLGAALLQMVMSFAPWDQTTHQEVFRYGMFMLPWTALLAGAGLAGVLDWIQEKLPAKWEIQWWWLVAPVALVIAATPVLNHGYLARSYGPLMEQEIFVKMADKVPDECLLIVPDDWREGGDFEIDSRYRLALNDLYFQPRGPSLPTENLVLISQVLDLLENGDTQPILGEDLRDRLRSIQAGEGGRANGECWYFLWGLYCDDGVHGAPVESCHRLLELTRSAVSETEHFEYWHHRTVTYPDLVESPWYDEQRALVLYRLPGLAQELARSLQR